LRSICTAIGWNAKSKDAAIVPCGSSSHAQEALALR
jgi:hypothetical protein